MRRSHQLNRAILLNLALAGGLAAGVAAASALGAPVGALHRGASSQELQAQGCTFAEAEATPQAGGRTTLCWTAPPTVRFTLRDASASARPSLYPGSTTPLDVEITNRSSVPLRVHRIDVAVRSSNTRCPARSIVPHSSRFRGTVEIPPHSTRALSEVVPSAEWPALGMPNTDNNQDACKNTTFDLTYSAEGTRP